MASENILSKFHKQFCIYNKLFCMTLVFRCGTCFEAVASLQSAETFNCFGEAPATVIRFFKRINSTGEYFDV